MLNRKKLKTAMPIALKVMSLAAILLLTFPVIALLLRGIETRGWEELNEVNLIEAISLSLTTTAVSTALIFIFGLPLAHFLARNQFRFKKILIILIELPIVLPPTVAGLALLLAAGRRGVLGGLLGSLGISLPFTTAAVVVAQIFVAAPFFIRAAQVGIQEIPHEIEDAARVDGANPYRVFRHITFPLAARSIGTGLTLSWARALGEFGATLLFAGNLVGRTQTMTLFIYNALESDLNAAIAASIILLGLAFFILIISQYLSKEGETN
jgi:molybdate transport system permease protein